MRAVDDGFDAPCPGHFADGFDRRDLPGDVDLMRYLDQLCSRGNSSFKSPGNLLDVFGRNRNLDQVQLDAFALLALPDRREHAAIVLSSSQDLVARFQIHTEQERFQRLRRVASDGDLFPITAKEFGQAGANRLGLRLENLPHRVRRGIFLLPDVTHQRFGDDARTGRDAAVVQIDHAARDREGLLNLKPEVFIHRGLFRREMRDRFGCRMNLGQQRPGLRMTRWRRGPGLCRSEKESCGGRVDFFSRGSSEV